MLIGNENICPLCFEKMSDNQTECYRCDGVSNLKRYPTSLEEGTILNGKYMIGKVIGRGGFGITYLALDLAVMTKVAIKEFFPNTLAHRDTGSTHISLYEDDRGEDFLSGTKSFINEAHIISGLNHNQNIVKVYDLFYENNTAYYVMEYLEGVNMKAYIKNLGRKLTEDETFRIINDLFPALTSVHSLNLLHRDISPDNIFICNDGRTKLIDFGASRQFLSEESRSLTVVLKHGFAPFEQYKTHGRQGPWTDVYALGATIYYALTGKVLLDAPSRTDNPYIEMSGIRPELANILLRMLSVDIENRYKSVEEVAADFMRINAGTGTYIPPVEKTEKVETNQGTIIKSKKEPEKVESNQKQDVSGNNTNAVNNSKPAQERKFKPGRTVLLLLIILISFGTVKNYMDKHGLPANDTFANVNVSENTTENSVDSSVNINTSTSDVLISVQTDEGWKVIDTYGKTVFELDEAVTDMTGFVNGIAAAKKSGKWGVINTEGEVIQNFSYDYKPEWDEKKRIAYVEKNDKYALMNNKGEIVTDFIYDNIRFSDGIIVKIEESYGLINSAGEEIVPVEFDWIQVIKNYVSVSNGNMHFDYAFKNITEDNLYNCTQKIPESLFAVEQNGKYGYENIDGEIVLPCKWNYCSRFSDGYALVMNDDNQYQYIDYSGKTALSGKYGYATSFSYGYAKAGNNGKYKYIDTDGNTVFSCSDMLYEYSYDFEAEGYALVSKDGKYGAIDKNGKLFINPEYDWISCVGTDIYKIKSDEKEGLIDSSGNILLECKYSGVYYSFICSFLVTADIGSYDEYYSYEDGELWFIDCDDVRDYSDGYFIIRKDEKYGIVDTKGNTVISCIYNDIKFSTSPDILIAQKDGKYGCINTKGETVIDFSYDNMA